MATAGLSPIKGLMRQRAASCVSAAAPTIFSSLCAALLRSASFRSIGTPCFFSRSAKASSARSWMRRHAVAAKLGQRAHRLVVEGDELARHAGQPARFCRACARAGASRFTPGVGLGRSLLALAFDRKQHLALAFARFLALPAFFARPCAGSSRGPGRARLLPPFRLWRSASIRLMTLPSVFTLALAIGLAGAASG